MTKKISLIVAADQKDGIGCNNRLLCHLPDDLKYFKKLTSGHVIIMGRKTFESIGKPLPNRTNLILSRQEGYSIADCKVIHSIPDLMQHPDLLNHIEEKQEVFIIGGESIFKQTIQYASKIYMTRINAELPADSFFPKIDTKVWKVEKKPIAHPADNKHPYSFSFIVYSKKYINSKGKRPTNLSQHVIDL